MKKTGVILLVLSVMLTAFAGEPFFFVQVTDAHMGQDDHFERMREVVRQIVELPMDIEFVVLTGDVVDDCITDSEIVDQVFQTLEPLRVPVHFLPGNHDILEENIAETTAAFTNRFGPLISSAEYGGVRCVFVYTEPLTGEVEIPGYDPLNALEPLLAGQDVLVFHHTPSVDSFYNGKAHTGWGRKEVGPLWVDLLNFYDVKAVIAGHFHSDEMHWLGEVPLFVCPPVSGRFGRQGSFRIYEYDDGQISYRTVYLN
jgi:DNA repair exonuclease SbcCD nuclease subunit